MKKYAKRIMSLTVIPALVLSMLPIGIGTQTGGHDPFASMYDAGVIIAEEIDALSLWLEKSDAVELPEETSAVVSEISRSNMMSRGEADVTRTRERIGKIGKLAVTGLTANQLSSELNTLELPEHTQEHIAEIIDRTMTDRFIIRYRHRNQFDRKANGAIRMERKAHYRNNPSFDTELLILPEKVNPAQFASELEALGVRDYIDYIQPDFALSLASLSVDLMETAGEPEDEKPNKSNDTPVVVAVIDTGIDSSHPMLAGYMIDGWNFTNQTGITYDATSPSASSHGTHIAGIIAQVAHETGANIQILPLQVFDNGVAYTSDILSAIEYAIEYGASVINCSFGSTAENPALFDAISNTDALFICAVGNNRRDLDETPSYPASYRLPNLLSVASVNADGGFSFYSNYSTNLVDITAVGRSVVSALPGGKAGAMTGTSVSSAYISGVAAVVAALDDVSVFELRQLLLESADRLDNLQNKVVNGQRINISNALSGTEGSVLSLNPADDFDVHGYQMTESERFELYSATTVVQVSAGKDHTLVLKSDGTVWSWGSNWWGQCGTGYSNIAVSLSQVIGLNNITAISAGDSHNLALMDDNTVWSWGYNFCGQLGDGTYTDNATPKQIYGIDNVTTISAGGNHSLAIADGTLYAWGGNTWGQLGNGTTAWSTTPVEITGFTDVMAISAGATSSLALKNDSTVWAWGQNWMGQLGDGTMIDQRTPVPVLELSGDQLDGVTAISAGYSHHLAIKDGTVWEWGLNGDRPELITGSFGSPLTNITAVAGGTFYSLALADNGTVWAWGYNAYGQLGDGTTTDSAIPIEITALNDVTAISAGSYHSLALQNGDTVWAWGRNNDGQLGDGTTTHRTTAVQMSGLSDILAISAGGSHNLALLDDDTVWAWGANWHGQLGNNTTTHSATPVKVAGLDGITVKAISAGGSHNLVLDDKGKVWAWGANWFGQLGDDTMIQKTKPIQITALSSNTIIAIAAGEYHSLALDDEGTVWSWGDNRDGQLGDGIPAMRKLTPGTVTWLNNVTAISAGEIHSLAIKDGEVWSWGGWSGIIPEQISSVSNATAISAGRNHSLVLIDGEVWAWGGNHNGQLGDGTNDNSMTLVETGLDNVTAISAGAWYSLARRNDGTVWTWGWNVFGQLGESSGTDSSIPVETTGVSNVTAISAGNYHAVTLSSDAVLSWGLNGGGQLGLPFPQDSSVPVLSQTTVPVSPLTITPDKIRLLVGDTRTITATMDVSDNLTSNVEKTSNIGNVLWHIDGNEITIKGKEAGLVELTFETSLGLYATVEIEVVSPYISEMDWHDEIYYICPGNGSTSPALRDRNISDGIMNISAVGDTSVIFENGVGMHAMEAPEYAEFQVDITGLNVTRFEAYVGIDRAARENMQSHNPDNGGVFQYEVLLNGNIVDSITVNRDDQVKYFNVALDAIDVETPAMLTLRVTAPTGDQAIDNGWVNWGDARVFADAPKYHPVLDAELFISDMPWINASSGWSAPRRDSNLVGNQLSIWGPSGTINYSKGIGSHVTDNSSTPAEIIIDIAGLDFDIFEVFVGMDREGRDKRIAHVGLSDVVEFKYEIEVVGTSTMPMTHYTISSDDDPYQLIVNGISGADILILRVYHVDNVYNPAGHGWVNWSNAKLRN
jgi:alpha-tubulin suppressor-like RCC1 family protein